MAKSQFDCSKEIKGFQAHKTGIKRAMVRTAKAGARAGRKAVQEDAPEDTGALKESIYVIAREASGRVTSDYETRIVDAADLNPRIGPNDQQVDEIAPPADGSPGDTRAWAATAIPVAYADLLIDGYHQGEREIPPNDFFNPAINRADESYQATAQKELAEEVEKLNK